MQVVKIQCRSCSTESRLSLIDSSYRGPFRCWKCRAIYMITMENNEVVSWEPLSEDEFDRKFGKKR